jgi:hypothetical protein
MAANSDIGTVAPLGALVVEKLVVSLVLTSVVWKVVYLDEQLVDL